MWSSCLPVAMWSSCLPVATSPWAQSAVFQSRLEETTRGEGIKENMSDKHNQQRLMEPFICLDPREGGGGSRIQNSSGIRGEFSRLQDDISPAVMNSGR